MTKDEKDMFHHLIIKGISRHIDIPLASGIVDVCNAFEQLSSQAKSSVLEGISIEMPGRSYRWCYLHYKKVYLRALYPHQLNMAERDQLKKDVTIKVSMGKPF